VFVFPELLVLGLTVAYWLFAGIAIVVTYPFNKTWWR
jgi:hypothetical protein